MSHYFSTHLRVAGKHEDIANFHARLMAKEGARPSDSFEFETLAFDREGRTTVVIYKAGQSRVHPTAENFAYSVEAADIPVVTEISRFYEDGSGSFQVFFGRDKLFEALDVYCLTEPDDPKIPPEVTAAERCFTNTVRMKFAISFPREGSDTSEVSY